MDRKGAFRLRAAPHTVRPCAVCERPFWAPRLPEHHKVTTGRPPPKRSVSTDDAVRKLLTQKLPVSCGGKSGVRVKLPAQHKRGQPTLVQNP